MFCLFLFFCFFFKFRSVRRLSLFGSGGLKTWARRPQKKTKTKSTATPFSALSDGCILVDKRSDLVKQMTDHLLGLKRYPPTLGRSTGGDTWSARPATLAVETTEASRLNSYYGGSFDEVVLFTLFSFCLTSFFEGLDAHVSITIAPVYGRPPTPQNRPQCRRTSKNSMKKKQQK